MTTYSKILTSQIREIGMKEMRVNNSKMSMRRNNEAWSIPESGLRVVNAWNRPPERVIASTLVNCFEVRYDRFACQSPEDDNPRSTQETSDP